MTNPSDWALRFQELAAEANRTYTRGARRYQDLLLRVSQGQLQPDSVQKSYQSYFQERAAGSTRELIESSVGLLTGLLHVEARYREAMLDGLLPPAGPPPPPPAPESVDLTSWFQTLATYAAQESTRAISRHQQLVDRVASGQISSAQVQEQGRRYLEAHAAQFLGEVMDLGLRFVGQLQRSSGSLTDGLYDRLLEPDVLAGEAGSQAPLSLELRGAAGSVATACLVIESTRSTETEVACRVSQFVARGGGERFDAAVEVSPSLFALAPGAQRDVNVRVMLDPTRFVGGVEHLGTLVVSGAGEQDLVVQLNVRAE